MFKKLSYKSDVVNQIEFANKNENKIIDYIDAYVSLIFLLIENEPDNTQLILKLEGGLLFDILNYAGTHPCKGYINTYDKIITLFKDQINILVNISWDIFIDKFIKPLVFNFLYQDEVKINLKLELIFRLRLSVGKRWWAMVGLPGIISV